MAAQFIRLQPRARNRIWIEDFHWLFFDNDTFVKVVAVTLLFISVLSLARENMLGGWEGSQTFYLYTSGTCGCMHTRCY